jgi:hypothetical protein
MKEEPAVKKMMDHGQCQELARHLVNAKGLPDECRKFRDIASDLTRRDADTTSPTQYLG